MNKTKLDELANRYNQIKMNTSIAGPEEILIALIKNFYDSDIKSDKKKSVKLLIKARSKLIEYNLM
ncbi:hypothetical protein [Sporolactobacillus laevolacticus]|uniref:Uncharacterized protein n=1 Tax=Sporolactobacillus laevolacticus DSM 442 TaxID=1395513 RepID=V6IXY5_9BACL|nr:hypothetical protein [Sporolactobacillus laevolacticus]EST12190.1 hypothetical protein P343_07690 [Sporolactobacillus laevolacticus DSM 442]